MIYNPTASSGKINVEELAELFAKAARGETVTVNGETVVWNLTQYLFIVIARYTRQYQLLPKINTIVLDIESQTVTQLT